MITQHKLKELLLYSEKSGKFIRKLKKGTVKLAGKEVGSKNNYGYVIVQIEGKNYLSHRLAWLYVYGEFPKDQIDHINHNKEDNRISNLREVTCAENCKNKKLNVKNISGCNGVCWDKHANKWRVELFGKHIGLFISLDSAIEKSKETMLILKCHSNHGKNIV